MKPLHLTTSRHSARGDRRPTRSTPRFARTDCHYRSPDEPRWSAVPPERKRAAAKSFRLISRDYWQSENRAEFARELTLFAIVTLLSAWPLIAMFQALASLRD